MVAGDDRNQPLSNGTLVRVVVGDFAHALGVVEVLLSQEQLVIVRIRFMYLDTNLLLTLPISHVVVVADHVVPLVEHGASWKRLYVGVQNRTILPYLAFSEEQLSHLVAQTVPSSSTTTTSASVVSTSTNTGTGVDKSITSTCSTWPRFVLEPSWTCSVEPRKLESLSHDHVQGAVQLIVQGMVQGTMTPQTHPVVRILAALGRDLQSCREMMDELKQESHTLQLRVQLLENREKRDTNKIKRLQQTNSYLKKQLGQSQPLPTPRPSSKKGKEDADTQDTTSSSVPTCTELAAATCRVMSDQSMLLELEVKQLLEKNAALEDKCKAHERDLHRVVQTYALQHTALRLEIEDQHKKNRDRDQQEILTKERLLEESEAQVKQLCRQVEEANQERNEYHRKAVQSNRVVEQQQQQIDDCKRTAQLQFELYRDEADHNRGENLSSVGDNHLPLLVARAQRAIELYYQEIARRQCLKENKEAVQTKLQCAICMDRMMDTVHQCGHAFCATCSAKVTQCPMCSTTIISRTRLFLT